MEEELLEVVAVDDVTHQPDEVEGVCIKTFPYRVECYGKDNGYLLSIKRTERRRILRELMDFGYEFYTYK